MGNPLLFRDPDGNDLVLFGTEGSCLTFETDLIDWPYNLNVNWGGTYTFKGNEALSAALDIVGVFDQSGISDAVNAGLQWSDGRHFDAIANAGSLKYLRRKAVKEAWKKEREMVIREGKGTIEWTEREINKLIVTGRVKGYVGHHINNVKHHPEMAGMQENVTFVKNGKDHLNAHGGNYRNETHGPLVSR